MSWKDEYTYDEIRKLGDRGDKLEQALAKLVETICNYHPEAATGSEAFNEAVELLGQMKLLTTKETLQRLDAWLKKALSS